MSDNFSLKVNQSIFSVIQLTLNMICDVIGIAQYLFLKSKTAAMYNMGLINKVDMVCLSPVGYGV